MSSKQKSIFTSYKLGVTYSTAKNKSVATKIVYDVAKTKSHCKNNVLDVQNSPTFDIQSINIKNDVHLLFHVAQYLKKDLSIKVRNINLIQDTA